MKKEILDRPLNSLVEGILDSYEKYPLIRNIDSTNRINRAIVLGKKIRRQALKQPWRRPLLW